MKTKLLIILFVFSLLSPTLMFHQVFGKCIDNPDWPSAPCYPPTDISIRKLRVDWNGYYDYKGKEWMEMKKIEIQYAIKNGTLENWIKEGPPLAHSNVHYYFYINGEIPDIDGRYIYEKYEQQDWLTLPVPGFDNSFPPTGDKTFKIKYSDVVQSIQTISDETLDFWGFDIKLKQNSDPILNIRIPRNFPTPASYMDMDTWYHNDGKPIVLADGFEVSYEMVEDPCFLHYSIPVENKTSVELSYTVILTGTWKLYSPVQFDENDPCYNEVFYLQSIEQQFVEEEKSESNFVTFSSGLNYVPIIVLMIAGIGGGICFAVIFLISRKRK
jgi:hypothetical protein